MFVTTKTKNKIVAMKKDKVTAKLVNLTQDLTAFSPEGDMQLDTIRRVVGYNLLRNRQDISLSKSHTAEFEPESTKEKVLEFGKYAVNKLSEDDKFIVKRLAGKENVPIVGLQIGEMRLPINPMEPTAEWRWNQKVGERIGPFNSQNGLPIWFDFYYFEDKLTVRSQNGLVPYFLFSKAKRNIWSDSFNLNQSVVLKAGYVWLHGKLFSPQAGSSDYIGLNITEGRFTIVNEKKWSGQFLDFKGDFSGMLTLQLVQPEKNAFDTEGCSAAQKIEFKYPNEVTFEWKNGQLINVSGSPGELNGYGNELTFDTLRLPVTYDAALNHIFIPCQASPQTWKADFSHSQLFTAEGQATIQSSFWALPIVRVTNPATLSEPENNGGWALRLTPDLTARWIGLDGHQPNAIPANTLVLLYPKALFLYSDKTKIDVTSLLEINQTFSCWNILPENTPRVPLHLNYKDEFPLIYYCHAAEGETLMAGCNGKMHPDRPIFAEGSLSNLDDLKGWVVFQAKGTGIKINALLQDSDALKKQPKPYALENALLIVSQATGLYLAGDLSKDNPNNIQSGSLTLVHGIFRWKPILPDPYVSNLRGGWDIRESSQYNRATSALYAQVQWEKPTNPIVTYKGELLLSMGVGIKPPSEPAIRPLPVNPSGEELDMVKRHEIDEAKREEKNRTEKIFDDLDKRLSGWKLLDVSTNMDLIGVSVGPNLFGRNTDSTYMAGLKTAETPQSTAFVVKDLAVHTPLSMVHVFTLPQVQWEPVRTLPEDQNPAALGWFPENLSSASDGGPTRLISISQELSPIMPEVVVRQIKDEYSKGKQAIALTTLSFGLKAGLTLTPTNTANRNADALNIVRPEFPNKNMKGGIQVNLMAESGIPKHESPSPGFQGLMVQTLNGYELFTGTELGLSVLGATLQSDASVESQFNAEFAPGGSNPFVPVTRFDLSGYGSSNFSEWENQAALASIGKVQFKIMVGRTAFEVIKFVSKIYPWGTTVTRSVTIERRSGGGVIRKDSGWQATQSGIFNFITPPAIPVNPYQFRPGVFKGCFDIKNIRPASNNIIQFSDPANGNNIELAPVYFDSTIQIDGQLDSNLLSRGILGFIQLEPKPDATQNPWLPRLLSKEALRKLINDQGAIGGPIDTMLNIGNSGFKFRTTRFEVDVTDNAGTPNFIAVLRGQPVLPNNGSWSVVKMAAPGNIADPQEATSADVSRGTPLFIENTWLKPSGNTMNVSGPSGPYRFADPVDLFAPQPRFDYGFMQNTGSQAFLFRRPVIVIGTNEISSNLKPAFADFFAMTTSKGAFPPIPNAIEFPTANYKLIIQSGTDKLRLNSPLDLKSMRPPLTVAQAGTGDWVVDYGQSHLKFNLNFNDWSVEFNALYFWTSMAGIPRLFGNSFNLKTGTGQRAMLVNVKSLLKQEIRDILTFIPGLGQDQELKDIDLGMTNSKKETSFFWGIECGIEIDLKTGIVESKCKGLHGYEEGEEKKKDHHKSIEIKFKLAAAQGNMPGNEQPPQLLAFAKLGMDFQAKLPIGGIWFIVLGLDWDAHWVIKPKPSETLEMKAYAGIGIGGYIGPFKAEAFIAGGIIIKIEFGKSTSVLWLVLLEAEIDLYIVSVSVNAELQGYVVKDGKADIGIASGEVAVNICIFLVININASYEHEEEENLQHH
jgi:hypothetical protein